MEKSGIDKHERLTLKINVREANLYNAAKANDLKAKNKARTPLDVPKGFKKVSRKSAIPWTKKKTRTIIFWYPF